MGLMIKGMLPSPTMVVTAFLVTIGKVGASLDNERLDNRQILFIVKPGMITDANACQMAASRKTSIDRLFFCSCSTPESW